MDAENVKVSGGILLMRSKSGIPKLQKVLVETKPGKAKSLVKCRLQKISKKTPSKIPVLVKSRRKERKHARLLHSLHASRSRIEIEKYGECSNESFLQDRGEISKSFTSEEIISDSIHELSEDFKLFGLEQTTNAEGANVPSYEENSSHQISQNTDSGIACQMANSEESAHVLEIESRKQSQIPVSKIKRRLPDKKQNQNFEEPSSSQKCLKDTLYNNSFSLSRLSCYNTGSYSLPLEPIEGSKESSLTNLPKEDIFETNSLDLKEDFVEAKTLEQLQLSHHSVVSSLPHEKQNKTKKRSKLKKSSLLLKKFTAALHIENAPKESTVPKNKPHGKEKRTIENAPVVMSQYRSIYQAPYDRGGFSKSEELDLGRNSDESGYEEVDRYIDSGLRPLRSNESRLYLDKSIYRSKKTVHTISDDDEIKPLLEEIPSSIFKKIKTPLKKKKSSKQIVKQQSIRSSRGDFTSEEDRSPSEPEDVGDSAMLKKLKEFEDRTFTIKAEGPVEDKKDLQEFEDVTPAIKSEGAVEGKKDDFCVHTKDLPEGIPTEFSSTTIDEPLKDREKKEKSIFRFFKKEDFCVHTADAPGSDAFSPEDSRESIVDTRKITESRIGDLRDITSRSRLMSHHERRLQSQIFKKSMQQIQAQPTTLTPKSPDRSRNLANNSSSQAELKIPKERRRSKSKIIQKRGDSIADDTSSSISSRSRSLNYSSSGSGLLMMSNKARRFAKSREILLRQKHKD